MKLIIFGLPDEIHDGEIKKNLDEMLKKMSIVGKAIILEKEDIEFQKMERPIQCNIIDDILGTCGNPAFVLDFTANFYRALTNCFGSSEKDVKIILNELLKGAENPIVVKYAQIKKIPYIFDLAKTALGMIR